MLCQLDIRITFLYIGSASDFGASPGQVDASKAGEQLLKTQQDKAAVLEEVATQRGQISGLETQLQALQVTIFAENHIVDRLEGCTGLGGVGEWDPLMHIPVD